MKGLAPLAHSVVLKRSEGKDVELKLKLTPKYNYVEMMQFLQYNRHSKKVSSTTSHCSSNDVYEGVDYAILGRSRGSVYDN